MRAARGTVGIRRMLSAQTVTAMQWAASNSVHVRVRGVRSIGSSETHIGMKRTDEIEIDKAISAHGILAMTAAK